MHTINTELGQIFEMRGINWKVTKVLYLGDKSFVDDFEEVKEKENK